MPHRALKWMSLAALLLAPAAAHAATYDLILADSIVVVSANTGGFTLGNNIALIVDTGPGNIGAADLSGATFTATSSDPTVDVQANILNAGLVTPILPNEAVGTLLSGSPLLAKVQAGETVRNVYPVGLFWLATSYPTGYTGTVVFNFTMTMGTDVVHYFTVATFLSGSEFSSTVVHADRVSSVSSPTASRTST
ncbi:MAG: hypothetical protein ACHQ52_13150 [Candidatus Eisenbacteria bacterium]